MFLWSGLPEELRELVFARSPWPQIYCLKIFSTGWNQKMSEKDSALRRACANAQPKLFAFLSPRDSQGSSWVTMLDCAAKKCHRFDTSMEYGPSYGEIRTATAGDGGLVCFISKVISKSKKIPLLVFVCNPLTRVWKRLPPLYGLVHYKIMVELIMDQETKHYRVIAVGHCKGPKIGNLAYEFHSETGEWTEADRSSKEVVYGYLYDFNEHAYFNSHRFPPVPCSYNSTSGQVLLIDTNLEPGKYRHKCELVKDHLFRLVRNRPTLAVGEKPKYCVEELQAENCGARRTRLKDYHINDLPVTRVTSPCAASIHYDTWWFTKFHTCRDFLVLYAYNRHEDRRQVLFWVYNLCSTE